MKVELIYNDGDFDFQDMESEAQFWEAFGGYEGKLYWMDGDGNIHKLPEEEIDKLAAAVASEAIELVLAADDGGLACTGPLSHYRYDKIAYDPGALYIAATTATLDNIILLKTTIDGVIDGDLQDAWESMTDKHSDQAMEKRHLLKTLPELRQTMLRQIEKIDSMIARVEGFDTSSNPPP